MKTFKGWKVPKEENKRTQSDYCFDIKMCKSIVCEKCLFGQNAPKVDFEEWKAQQ